jgi:hypothetical protein
LRLNKKTEERLILSLDSLGITEHLAHEYLFNITKPQKKISEEITSPEEVRALAWEYYFQPFIGYYLEKEKSQIFKDETFNKIYKFLEEQLCTENIPPNVFCAPLFNFKMNTEKELNFEDYLCVRRMTSIEKNLGKIFLKDLLSEKHYRELKLAICWVADDSKRQSKSEYDNDDILTVMRLLKQEPVQAPYVLTYPAEPLFGRSIKEMSIHEVGSPLLHGKTYSLTENDAQQLLAIWHGYRDSRAKKKYAIAFDKFEDVYKKVRADDRIIDCWVGLENIYLRGIKDELRYRASIRIAYFLGSNSDERQRLYKEAMNSYDIRSKLVHGGRVTEKSIKVAAQVALSHLRDSLHFVLNEDKARQLDEIDKTIIMGEVPKN